MSLSLSFAIYFHCSFITDVVKFWISKEQLSLDFEKKSDLSSLIMKNHGSYKKGVKENLEKVGLKQSN